MILVFLVLLVFFQLIESRTVVYDLEMNHFCSLLNGREYNVLKTITFFRITMIEPMKGTQFNRKSDWSNGWMGLYYWSNHFVSVFRNYRLCMHFYRVSIFSGINYYAQIVFIRPKGVKIQKLIKSETNTWTPYF